MIQQPSGSSTKKEPPVVSIRSELHLFSKVFYSAKVQLSFLVILVTAFICFNLSALRRQSFVISLQNGGWMGGLERPSSAKTAEMDDDAGGRVKFHLVSISTRPLEMAALLVVDSIFRHMNDSIVKLHVTAEDEIPLEVLATRVHRIREQLHPFYTHGLDVRLILHLDASSLSRTPLNKTGITRRHLGGVYKRQSHWSHFAHAADLLRVIILHAEGGIYMDLDSIVLKDFSPMLQKFGPNLLTTDGIEDSFSSCEIRVANGWFAFEAGHPFLTRVIDRFAEMLTPDSVDCFFPLDEHQEQTCGWTTMGPDVFSDVHSEYCQRPFQPLMLSDASQMIPQKNVATTTITTPELNNFLNNRDSQNEKRSLKKIQQERPKYPYAVLARKYVIPLHWSASESNYLLTSIEEGPAVLEAKRHKLDSAYFFHMFGAIKKNFMDLLHDPPQRPMMNLVWMKACRLLCSSGEKRYWDTSTTSAV